MERIGRVLAVAPLRRRGGGAVSMSLPCSNLVLFLFCGEVLSKNLVACLQARFPSARIVGTHGPTEAIVSITAVSVRISDVTSLAQLV